jgi:hypothetical protein
VRFNLVTSDIDWAPQKQIRLQKHIHLRASAGASIDLHTARPLAPRFGIQAAASLRVDLT